MVPAVAGTDAGKVFRYRIHQTHFRYHTNKIIPCFRSHRNTPRRTEAGRMIKYPGIVLLFCKVCRNGIRYAPQACGKQIRMFLFLPYQTATGTATGNGNTYRRTGNHSFRFHAENSPKRADPEAIPEDLFIFRSWKKIPDQIGTRERMQKRTMKKYLPKLFPNRYILPVFRYELRFRK